MFGIDTPLSMIGAIGTIAQEASSFLPVEEAFWLTEAQRNRFYADTSQHAPYQGGIQFHGRGFVQTTHRYNYERVMVVLRERFGMIVDLVNHPELLLDPVIASVAFAVYWSDHNLQAVSESMDWAGVRRGVFGGNDPAGTAKVKHAADVLIPLATARGLFV